MLFAAGHCFRSLPGQLTLITNKTLIGGKSGLGHSLRFKRGIDFAHFGLESGMASEETTGIRYERIYRFNSKGIRKKEKYANSKKILRNLFCWRSNPSNDDIIY